MFSVKAFTRYFLAAAFFNIATLTSFANRTTDSLYAALKLHKEDTVKVRILAALSYELASQKPDEALLRAQEVLNLSRKLNFKEGEAIGSSRIALAYKQLTKYDSAFHYFFTSRDIFSTLRNKEGEAAALTNLGLLYSRTGDNDSAINYFFRSLKLAEETGDKSLQGSAFTSIALVLRLQGNTDDAIEYNLKALQLYENIGNKKNMAVAGENLGICYAEKKDFRKAQEFYAKSMATYEELEDKRGLGRININISSMLSEQGKFDEAIACALKSAELYKEIKNLNGEAAAYTSLSELHFLKNEYSKASEFAAQSLNLSFESGNRQRVLECYHLLHRIFSAAGDYKAAYSYLNKASALKDSLFNEKRETIVSELQTKYETEKKESEIKLLSKDKELSTAKIQRQETVRNSIIAGTVLLIVIGFLLFNRYRISQKHRRQQERMRISSDLHDEIGSTLSSIGMYSAFAAQQLEGNKTGEAKNILGEISSSSQEMIDDMNDIIWAINPRNDSLESIINRLRNYTSRMAESKNILLDFRNDDSLHDMNLNMDTRKNIFLICKEAVNNAVKYSDCKNLSVAFHKSKGYLSINIRDDGKGFEAGSQYEGNGLKNMKQRAKQAGADISIKSVENKGTEINFEMKMT